MSPLSHTDFEASVVGALTDPPPNWVVAVAGADGPPVVVGDDRLSYRLASVTKVLTSMSLWLALEEQSVSLDDPAGPAGSTLAHLLAHASGLPFEGDTPIAPPGVRRIYSNAGFEAAARHLADRTGLDVATYLREGWCQPLGLVDTELLGSPAWSATSTAADLIALGRQLLWPSLLAPETVARGCQVAWAGLDGVLPGYGRQAPNSWGLGVELRGTKSPHWTGSNNSPATVGHFGQSGTFLWADPEAHRVCVFLGDRPFGRWAVDAWPVIGDAALSVGLPGGPST
ncbi:MAG: serine hydrolase domain-containing protein [Microthrixaceae bacterium]